MNITSQEIVFAILAAVILAGSILTVTTKRILRAATYLLFVLFATAGIFFQLNYSFLGAVQLAVYAGGVIVLFVFSIFLTSSPNGEHIQPVNRRKMFAALGASLVGAVLCTVITLSNPFVMNTSAEFTTDVLMIDTDLPTTAADSVNMTDTIVLSLAAQLEVPTDDSTLNRASNSQSMALETTSLNTGDSTILTFPATCSDSTQLADSIAAELHTMDSPLHQETIGKTLMGTDKYQFLLPFELISVLLLACIIGGIMIARKR